MNVCYRNPYATSHNHNNKIAFKCDRGALEALTRLQKRVTTEDLLMLSGHLKRLEFTEGFVAKIRALTHDWKEALIAHSEGSNQAKLKEILGM